MKQLYSNQGEIIKTAEKETLSTDEGLSGKLANRVNGAECIDSIDNIFTF